jgi:hypothetical protein
MNKKGQAAMEFLMTYGWAILVVIAAIAALAFFGVLDPARLLPERCTGTGDVPCDGKAAITTDMVVIPLRNNIGGSMIITTITTDLGLETSCAGGTFVAMGSDATEFPITDPIPLIQNNNNFRIIFRECGLTSGEKFDEEITFTYTDQRNFVEYYPVVQIRGRVA